MINQQYIFPTFQPQPQSKTSLLFWMILLWFMVAVLLFFNSFTFTPYLYLNLIVFTILSLLTIYFWLKNKKTLYLKKGIFTGNLILSEKDITINSESFKINDIEKIEIHNPDFLYKYQNESLIKPYLSIGVNNMFVLYLKNGKKHSVYFQQKIDNELMRAESVLKYYTEQKILNTKNLIKITTNPFQ